jgi:phosphopantothenoylcysteine decarboxylase/phosphopantothenate--cysteine ligase
MPDPHLIADRVMTLRTTRDLGGQRFVVTAGPTREPIDPVRYITNRSSGKMGYAVAEAARDRGADVTLISGPTSLPRPAGMRVINVLTASEMHSAVIDQAAQADVLVKAAAVADYTPVNIAVEKIKRKREGELVLELKPTSDILEAVSKLGRKPLVVAFAAETNDVLENARAKLIRKGADLIVANDVSDSTIGFDVEQNQVTVIDSDGESYHFERAAKRQIADHILDLVAERLSLKVTRTS